VAKLPDAIPKEEGHTRTNNYQRMLPQDGLWIPGEGIIEHGLLVRVQGEGRQK